MNLSLSQGRLQGRLSLLLCKYSEKLAAEAKVKYMLNAIIPLLSIEKWEYTTEKVHCLFLTTSPIQSEDKIKKNLLNYF